MGPNCYLGKLWFLVGSGQQGVGMGVQCNARVPTEHLVFHHHRQCWLLLKWSAPTNQVCKVWSSWDSLYAMSGPFLGSREVFGSSQTAPRHEKLLEGGQVLSLLPGHGGTYKQVNSIAHRLHWNSGNSMQLSKHSYHVAIPFLEPSCILGP